MDKKYIIAGIGLLAGGFGIGYVSAYAIHKKKMEDWANDEISSVKAFYDPFRKEGVFSTPESAAEVLLGPDEMQEVIDAGRAAVDRMLQEEGYAPLNGGELEVTTETEVEMPFEAADDLSFVDEPSPITGETIVQAILNNTAITPGVNTDQTFVSQRHPDKPYVISIDEFMTDDPDVTGDHKISLLYFEGDGQMIDERESLVNNVEELVGEGNLAFFGMGSKDKNAVYIRNEKLGMDFEVMRDTRTFNEVVLGISPDKVDSSPRKMRDDDQ